MMTTDFVDDDNGNNNSNDKMHRQKELRRRKLPQQEAGGSDIRQSRLNDVAGSGDFSHLVAAAALLFAFLLIAFVALAMLRGGDNNDDDATVDVPAAAVDGSNSYFDVYPNVVLVGEAGGVASIAKYTLRAYPSNACGPVYYTGPVDTSRSEDSQDTSGSSSDDDGGGATGGHNDVVQHSDDDETQNWVEGTASQYLYDWDNFRNEKGENATDLDVLRGYLYYYQHCRKKKKDDGGGDTKVKNVRIEATGDDINIPDAVRKVYDLLFGKDDDERRSRTAVKIFVVLPLFAIDHVLSRNFTSMDEVLRQNYDGYSYCVLREDNFYTNGLVASKDSCRSLGSYWRNLFPNQVTFVPCEFLHTNLTLFRLWWEESLFGLKAAGEMEKEQADTQPPTTTTKASQLLLEPPYSIDESIPEEEEDDDEVAAAVRITRWEGSYSNRTYEPRLCVPHVSHVIRGDVTTTTMTRPRRRHDAIATQPSRLVFRGRSDLLLHATAEDPVKVRSGYYHVDAADRDGNALPYYYPVPSIYLDFRKTNRPGTYNINGTSDGIGRRGWERITVRGVLETARSGGGDSDGERVTWNIIETFSRSS